MVARLYLDNIIALGWMRLNKTISYNWSACKQKSNQFFFCITFKSNKQMANTIKSGIYIHWPVANFSLQKIKPAITVGLMRSSIMLDSIISLKPEKLSV